MPDYTFKRLNFRLPDFTRSVWISNQAGEIWYPKINQVLNYLREIDLISVAEGIRDCTIRLIDSEELSSIKSKFSSSGLQVEFLRNNENTSLVNPIKGKQGTKYWVVIGSPENNQSFKNAFKNADQNIMSILQGSPDCCATFFYEMGIVENFLDLTWPMAVNTNLRPEEENQENIINIDPVFQCNTLLKSLGIKPVFHSPCSFDCPKTIDLANKLIALGEKAGYSREITWLREILNWPVEWTALHGIAEIKNPVLKISTYTDASAVKYTVRFKGKLYPEEAVPGLVFPYMQPDKLLISDSKSFKEGLLNDPSDEKK